MLNSQVIRANHCIPTVTTPWSNTSFKKPREKVFLQYTPQHSWHDIVNIMLIRHLRKQFHLLDYGHMLKSSHSPYSLAKNSESQVQYYKS